MTALIVGITNGLAILLAFYWLRKQLGSGFREVEIDFNHPEKAFEKIGYGEVVIAKNNNSVKILYRTLDGRGFMSQTLIRTW